MGQKSPIVKIYQFNFLNPFFLCAFKFCLHILIYKLQYMEVNYGSIYNLWEFYMYV
jgi:hypothetical protein